MDMDELNEWAVEHHLFWTHGVLWKLTHDDCWKGKDIALSFIHVPQGIGIVERNVKGYTPTLITSEWDWKEEKDIMQRFVDLVNEHMFHLSEREAAEISMSTFR